MLHFKEKIYQICGCIAGILFAIFGFINAAGLRGTGLEKIYIISFNVVYGCIILLSLFLVFSEEKGSAASAVLLFAVLAGSFSVFLSQPFFRLREFRFKHSRRFSICAFRRFRDIRLFDDLQIRTVTRARSRSETQYSTGKRHIQHSPFLVGNHILRDLDVQ